MHIVGIRIRISVATHLGLWIWDGGRRATVPRKYFAYIYIQPRARLDDYTLHSIPTRQEKEQNTKGKRGEEMS